VPDLLLAAPAGARPTMGLDPGYRTGVKVAVVTGTGQVAATTIIYPHEPQRRLDESIAQLARLVQEHRVELIAIGNGTASRVGRHPIPPFIFIDITTTDCLDTPLWASTGRR
jgi:uncharacterized protein